MARKALLPIGFAGSAAGVINGLFGGGGGMVLVPLLTRCRQFKAEEVFPSSVCIILPICVVSLLTSQNWGSIPWDIALPCLVGSALGGIASGIWGKHVPTCWLHRLLGIFIIWGGIRYLC